jgi:hypothetical protein
MNKFLKFYQASMFLIAIIFGLVIGKMTFFQEVSTDKLALVQIFSPTYIVLISFIELFALRLLNTRTKLQIRNNPLLKLFVIQLTLLLGGAWFVYAKFKLNDLTSCVIFSILNYFFIGGIFETCRYLRKPK